ncbi:MAG TPA: efflux RND transporter periplasmic adaptor subunit [Burkholderiaceae bacterium]|nr:efflux RND transporter periplasmic adaptor subunit [Burkholderiaceae bacterium]
MKRSQLIAIAAIIAITAILGLLIVEPMLDRQADDHAGHDHGPDGAHEEGRKTVGGADKAKAGHAHRDERLGSVHLSEDQQHAAGLRTEAAGPANLVTTLTLPGEIRLNEDRTAHVVPRVGGVVESVGAILGQPVRKGQVLAVIASTTVSDQRSELNAAQRRLELARSTFEREKRLWEEKISAEQDYQQARAALQEAEIAVTNARQKLAAIGIAPTGAGGNRFELRAPFDGIVLEKHVTLGEAVKEDTNIYTISDLSTVWANFNVAAADLNVVKLNARATVRAPSLDAESSGNVSYVGSLIGENTRTATARVTVPNPQGAWRPGLFVNVTIVAGERRAALTVPDEAIQTLDGKPHVFVKTPDGFQARAVELRGGDGQRTEVRSGLQSGEQVVGANSFVLKSELEKGSAEHTH